MIIRNAWAAQNAQKNESTKPIRPQPKNKKKGKNKNKKKEENVETNTTDNEQPKQSVIELAQHEEMQLRSLAQHEYEWMIDAPQLINNKSDDYDSFLKQQELLLASFKQEQNQQEAIDESFRNNSANRDYGSRGRGYGYNRGRGRGGRRSYDDDGYNDNYGGYSNNRGRGRGRARGRGRGRGGYRGNNRQYNNDRGGYNDNYGNNRGGYYNRGRGGYNTRPGKK